MMRFYQTSESADNGEVSPRKNKFLAFMEKLEKQERTAHRSKRRAIGTHRRLQVALPGHTLSAPRFFELLHTGKAPVNFPDLVDAETQSRKPMFNNQAQLYSRLALLFTD
jgi:hypothetical protein